MVTGDCQAADGAVAALAHQSRLEPRPGHAFFGATPELLADVQGRNMKSMALAGSVARGATRDEDETLARQMLADSKERHEHALVAKTMSRRLATMGETKATEVPGVLKLANIQHLHTPLYCRLNKLGGTLSLVKLLHPSPALGGTPRTAALKLISELEPVPRGWYAGPVGCLTMQLDGTFVVAIRSAICQERRMWLYAGAGIVEGSVAQREWEESERKFRPVLAAMGLQEGQPDYSGHSLGAHLCRGTGAGRTASGLRRARFPVHASGAGLRPPAGY